MGEQTGTRTLPNFTVASVGLFYCPPLPPSLQCLHSGPHSSCFIIISIDPCGETDGTSLLQRGLQPLTSALPAAAPSRTGVAERCCLHSCFLCDVKWEQCAAVEAPGSHKYIPALWGVGWGRGLGGGGGQVFGRITAPPRVAVGGAGAALCCCH